MSILYNKNNKNDKKSHVGAYLYTCAFPSFRFDFYMNQRFLHFRFLNVYK